MAAMTQQVACNCMGVIGRPCLACSALAYRLDLRVIAHPMMMIVHELLFAKKVSACMGFNKAPHAVDVA